MAFSDDGPLSGCQVDHWLRNNVETASKNAPSGSWAIERKSDATTIGYLKLTSDLARTEKDELELGIRLAHQYWGHGYAIEAATEMIRNAFLSPATTRIIGIVDPDNSRSVRLLKKIGMTYQREVEFEGYDHPDYLFSIDRFDYQDQSN